MEISLSSSSLVPRIAYTDPMIEAIRTATGILVSADNLGGCVRDLVIVHTLQPATDHCWLTTAPVVLDATYQLRGHGSHYCGLSSFRLIDHPGRSHRGIAGSAVDRQLQTITARQGRSEVMG